MSKHPSKSKKLGFTLIEMAVVLLIIGVLAGIVLRNIGGQGADARDKRRIADLNNLGIQLVQYSNIKGYYPATAATGSSSGWDDSFKKAFEEANLSTQLPLPPTSDSKDVYNYYPCKRGSGASTGTAFILRAKLEQSASTAPALYKQSYNSSSPPSGWICNDAPSNVCLASENFFCYTQ